MTVAAPGRTAVVTAVDETGPAAAWVALRALHVVTAEEGLVGYVAGDLSAGSHVLDITGPHQSVARYRHLLRGEALAWSYGVAAVHGLTHLIDAVTAEPVPALLTPAQAAQVIPTVNRGRVMRESMTVDGIEYNLTSGALYPLYVTGRGRGPSRMLFEAQALAEAARRRAADPRATPAAHTARTLAEAAWMLVRGQLPPAISETALGRDVSPRPSVMPLPLPELLSPNRRPMPRRWTEALILAHEAGLLEYDGPEPDRSAYRVRLVDTNGNIAEMAVPGDRVLAWLLGVADGRDAAGLAVRSADAIAYRDWLG